MGAKEINQTVQVVNGKFSPFEASDMLNELVTSIINYRNIQLLRMWEGNHDFNSTDWDTKIEAMKREKSEAIALISKAKSEGLNVEIIGNIEVRLSA